MVMVSIGGVQVGEKIVSIGQVLVCVSECIQVVVELGNICCIFDLVVVDCVEEECVQCWVVCICEVLVGDGFQFYYQLVLNLQGELLELYEVYLCLENNGELLSLMVFLGIVEEYGLLVDINCWVVLQVIVVLGECVCVGYVIQVLVKVMLELFDDLQMIVILCCELQVQGVFGEWLWLYVLEVKVFIYLCSVQQFFVEVVFLGCCIGLEQFGFGLDLFQLLVYFQLQFFKLDWGFISDLVVICENIDCISQIIVCVQEVGICIIVEFVSDVNLMMLLFSVGVDYVQGDFVGLVLLEMGFEFG